MQEQQTIQSAFHVVAKLFMDDLYGTDSALFPHPPSFSVAVVLAIERSEPNSIAFQDTDDRYRIGVSLSLLDILYKASLAALDDCPSLFEYRDEALPQSKARCQAFIFNVWMDYLFCHGLAHIDCGHLNYNNQIREWPEIIYTPPSERNLDAYTYKRLEVDADSRAAQFSLSRFARHWLPVARAMYRQPSTHTALSDFLSAIILLFRHLGALRASVDIATEVYPQPIDRAIIFLSCCEDHYSKVAGLPPLSTAERESLFGLRLAKSYVDALGANRLECLLSAIDTTTLSASAAQLTKQLELKRLGDKT